MQITNNPNITVPLNVDVNSAGFGNGNPDTFGAILSEHKNNQIEVSFLTNSFVGTLFQVSVSGSGYASQANGLGQVGTGTSANGAIEYQSTNTTQYVPGHEIYSMFTAAFTQTTNSNSFQRIGHYDIYNGFFVGFSGTTFGITSRKGGTDTFVSQTNFNLDNLINSPNFTKTNIRQTFNPYVSNIFRIRFGWLGSAPIFFEILSPDDKWVTFHCIYQPNSVIGPSVYTPDNPISIEVSKIAGDATDLIIYTSCWAAGANSGSDTPNSIWHGIKNVAVAGARVQIDTFLANPPFAVPIKSICVKARSTNTKLIYVGGGYVTAANGFQLSAGDSVSLDITRTLAIYLDADVNGEGVSWMAVT